LAGKRDSPEEAVDAFVARSRGALDCILNGATFASGISEGVEHGLVFYAVGQAIPNVARLSTYGGTGEILFRLAHRYVIVRAPESGRRRGFEIAITFYQYRILDIGEHEIIVYDWDPVGPSDVRTPHLHVPAAGSIILEQRVGSPLASRKTYLGSLHLPTGQIEIEDIVELLIREFQVVPHRHDWQEVLAANRQEAERTHG
jgi:hypothetical protein